MSHDILDNHGRSVTAVAGGPLLRPGADGAVVGRRSRGSADRV